MTIGTTNVRRSESGRLKQRAHRRGIRERETGRGQDDPDDVDQADHVPREIGAAAPGRVGPRDEDQEQGRGGHHDVSPAPGHGEGPRQLPSRVEGEEVEADEAREVEQHERAQVHRLHEPAQRGPEPSRGQEGDGDPDQDELRRRRPERREPAGRAHQPGGRQPGAGDRQDTPGGGRRTLPCGVGMGRRGRSGAAGSPGSPSWWRTARPIARRPRARPRIVRETRPRHPGGPVPRRRSGPCGAGAESLW